MKAILKSSLLLALVALIFSACSSTNKATSTSAVSRSDISGKWTVTNVTLDNFPTGYSVGRVFDLADYQDFQGSTWDLNGGGSGSITLANGTVQPIYWSLNKTTSVPTFQFKKLMDGQKAKDVETGYSLEFGNVSDGSAVLKSPVSLSSGQVGYVNLTVAKQ